MKWLTELRRRRLLRRAPAGPLKELLGQPWPQSNADVNSVRLLAIDFETTGLDPARDVLVSAAWVPIETGRIQLAEAYHRVVRPESERLTADSIRIHQIGHDRADAGVTLESMLQELFVAMRGSVLVAHHAGMDLAFLSAACRRVYGSTLSWPSIDTLRLLELQSKRRQQPIPASGLRLSAARARFGLPNYPNHDALWDAIGVAELWLALSADWAGGNSLSLGRVVSVLPS